MRREVQRSAHLSARSRGPARVGENAAGESGGDMSPTDETARVVSRPETLIWTAPNPGPKTLDGTHAYVVGRDKAYVIDPGPAVPNWTNELAARVKAAALRVEAIVLTHGHPDHAPAATELSQLLRAPVMGSASIESTAGDSVRVDAVLREGDALETDGDRLIVIETPGHSPDHLGFWLEGAKVLFSGDTILGRGTSLVAPPEGDMQLYMRTLDTLRRLSPLLIAPGHGPIVRDPLTTIDQYIDHRRARERQLLTILQRGPATIRDLVDEMYAGVDRRLHELARGSVAAQLEKLEREGLVERDSSSYRVRPLPPVPE